MPTPTPPQQRPHTAGGKQPSRYANIRPRIDCGQSSPSRPKSSDGQGSSDPHEIEIDSYRKLLSKYTILYLDAAAESHEEEDHRVAEEQAENLITLAAKLTGINHQKLKNKRILKQYLPSWRRRHPSPSRQGGGKGGSMSPKRISDSAKSDQQEQPEDITSYVEPFKKGGAVADDMALQRFEFDQQHAFKLFTKIDHKCEEIIYLPENSSSFSLKEAALRMAAGDTNIFGSTQAKGEAVAAHMSTRFERERRRFTQRALKVVLDMKQAVLKRQKEIGQYLQLQEEERQAAIQEKNNEERARELMHQRQLSQTRERWRTEEREKKRVAAETKRNQQLQAANVEAINDEMNAATQRKQDYLSKTWGVVQQNQHRRQWLHDYNETQRVEKEKRDAEQSQKDFEAREEALRARNFIQKKMSNEEAANRNKDQRRVYNQNEARLHTKINDIETRNENYRRQQRHRAVQAAKEAREEAERIRQLDEKRKNTLLNAKNIAAQRAAETEMLVNLSDKQSERYKAYHRHMVELRRDQLNLVNEARMQQVEENAARQDFNNQCLVRAWLARKETLEEQDSILTDMKLRLRQDKQRLEMKTNFLKSSQKKGDLKRLDTFVEELDVKLEKNK